MKILKKWPYNLFLPIGAILCFIIIVIDSGGNKSDVLYGIVIGMQIDLIIDNFLARKSNRH